MFIIKIKIKIKINKGKIAHSTLDCDNVTVMTSTAGPITFESLTTAPLDGTMVQAPSMALPSGLPHAYFNSAKALQVDVEHVTPTLTLTLTPLLREMSS